MEGWIKLHRKLLDNDLWRSEPFTRGQAWVDLLLLANHKESFFYKRGNKVIVKRGQVGRSSVELSDRWRWSRTKVSKFLKDLEKEQQISIYKSTVTQVITVVNYDEFQEKEQQTKQQKDSKKTTEEQQKNTYKNDKNNKEGKEENKYIVDYLDVCSFFESETGKKLRQGNTESKIKKSDKFKIVKARFNDGATVEELKSVIRLKNKQWKDDPKMKQYIQFSTLFGKRNFDKYMDEIINSKSYVAPKTTAYQVPDFDTPEERQFFFLRRYTKYTETGILEQRLINTEYRQRALMEKDAEGMCYFLENKYPELLNIEFLQPND